jgi:creatinine amidohydrolase/Fe(II)-dependent formamide hydrolase-like protein
VPIHSWEFSIVDGVGFTSEYYPDRVVRNDPRRSTAEEGRQLFEETLDELVAAAEQLMAKK